MPEQECEATVLAGGLPHAGEVVRVTLEIQPAYFTLATAVASKRVWLCAEHRNPPARGLGSADWGMPARVVQKTE